MKKLLITNNNNNNSLPKLSRTVNPLMGWTLNGLCVRSGPWTELKSMPQAMATSAVLHSNLYKITIQ